MLPWNGLRNRGSGWNCAFTILMSGLALAMLSVGDNGHAAQKRAGIQEDKTEALLKSGYVALAGDDAVSFLVGNSVVIKKADTPRRLRTQDYDRRYYFSDGRTVYECFADDCSTQSWKVDGQVICFEIPERCEDPTHRFYQAPRLFKAPRPDERTGRIGVYLTYKSIIHAVVRGNATIAPLFEPGAVGKMIDINPAEYAQEIEASSKSFRGDNQVPVNGARAISFLIGNTFISGETVTDQQGVHLCPVQGYFYSPDGRIITFNCHHWPDFWSMHVTHWKLASGRLCIEDNTGNGAFGCGERFETVYLTPPDRRDEWQVVTDDSSPSRKIVGYAGNVFKFK